MKALVFAAGLGTRLKPYTNDRPKALVEIKGRSLLDLVLTRLRVSGITEAVVNVHHFADLMCDYLSSNDIGMNIRISDERSELLETGGGVKKAGVFLNDGNAFLVHNVDILSNLDISRSEGCR